MSKSAEPSWAYVPSVQSTDNKLAAPKTVDNPPIATNNSGWAFALSLPLAFVPALISQPLVVAKHSSFFWIAPSPPKNLGRLSAEVDFPHKAIFLSFYKSYFKNLSLYNRTIYKGEWLEA